MLFLKCIELKPIYRNGEVHDLKRGVWGLCAGDKQYLYYELNYESLYMVKISKGPSKLHFINKSKNTYRYLDMYLLYIIKIRKNQTYI